MAINFNTNTTESTGSGEQLSVLSAGVRIKGEVFSAGPMHIDGQVQGSLQARQITLGATGFVDGHLVCESFNALGIVQGQVKCEDISVGPQASLSGVIRAEAIVLSAGGRLDGDVVIGHADAPRATPAPTPEAAAAPAADALPNPLGNLDDADPA